MAKILVGGSEPQPWHGDADEEVVGAWSPCDQPLDGPMVAAIVIDHVEQMSLGFMRGLTIDRLHSLEVANDTSVKFTHARVTVFNVGDVILFPYNLVHHGCQYKYLTVRLHMSIPSSDLKAMADADRITWASPFLSQVCQPDAQLCE